MTAGDPRAPLRCLIVDDEPLARRILEGYVEEHPLLAHVGSRGSALDALAVLQTADVDVLFLDIQMPGLTGLGLLRSLSHPPRVVLTTAHGEHALEGFDLGVVDYLVKPIGQERFLRAVGRLTRGPGGPATVHAPAPSEPAGCIFVRVGDSLVRLGLDEIDAVEACENYVRFHTAGPSYMTKRTLREVEAVLPADRFARVHRSFLVNLSRVDRVEGNVLWMGTRQVPISRGLRTAVLALLPIA